MKRWLSQRGINPVAKTKKPHHELVSSVKDVIRSAPPPLLDLQPTSDRFSSQDLTRQASALDHLFDKFIHKQEQDLGMSDTEQVTGGDAKASLERLFGNSKTEEILEQTAEEKEDDALALLLGAVAPIAPVTQPPMLEPKQNKLLAMLTTKTDLSGTGGDDSVNIGRISPMPLIKPHQASLLAVLTPNPKALPIAHDKETEIENTLHLPLPTVRISSSSKGQSETSRKQQALLEQMTAGIGFDVPGVSYTAPSTDVNVQTHATRLPPASNSMPPPSVTPQPRTQSSPFDNAYPVSNHTSQPLDHANPISYQNPPFPFASTQQVHPDGRRSLSSPNYAQNALSSFHPPIPMSSIGRVSPIPPSGLSEQQRGLLGALYAGQARPIPSQHDYPTPSGSGRPFDGNAAQHHHLAFMNHHSHPLPQRAYPDTHPANGQRPPQIHPIEAGFNGLDAYQPAIFQGQPQFAPQWNTPPYPPHPPTHNPQPPAHHPNTHFPYIPGPYYSQTTTLETGPGQGVYQSQPQLPDGVALNSFRS